MSYINVNNPKEDHTMLKMTFMGNTPEELTGSIRTFVKEELKGAKRGGKDDVGGDAMQGALAPAPLAPPVGGIAFNPGGAPAAFNPSGSAVPPEVTALVNRIIVRIEGALASGQPAQAMLDWFRGQCGPEAAQATMDQIKQVLLPKAAVPTLENIAKLMNA